MKIIKISINKNKKIINSHYSCFNIDFGNVEKELVYNQIRKNLLKKDLRIFIIL